MKISLELVPSKFDQLLNEVKFSKQNFPEIDMINIPDLLRFEIRSWDGCEIVKDYFEHAIPHIRAIDIDLEQPLVMAPALLKNNILEVLIITGDIPQEMNRKIYQSTSLEVISKFKRELPHIKVFAAIDPYRDSIKKELNYVKRKLNAGADGFFTQPFFDMRSLEIYSELLEEQQVFFGISPVLSERSQSYWYAKNNVIFPKGFKPDLDWNVDFAQQVMQYCEMHDRNVYFMPIKTSIEHYLSKVLKK